MGIGINHEGFQCTHAFLVLYISHRSVGLQMDSAFLMLAVCSNSPSAVHYSGNGKCGSHENMPCRLLFTRNRIHPRPQPAVVWNLSLLLYSMPPTPVTRCSRIRRHFFLGHISSIGWLWLKDSLTSFAKPSLELTTFQDAFTQPSPPLTYSGLDVCLSQPFGLSSSF